MLGKRQIPFAAKHHEIGHGRYITWALRAKEAPEHIKADWPGTAWIVELVASGSRDGKPFKAQGCLKVRSSRAVGRRHPSQRQHCLDVVGQLPKALAD